MVEFFAELKRRHMYRVGAAYAVVAWLLLQLFNNLAPIYELAPWIGRAFVFLLVLGFPVALLICWVQQVRQEGGAPKSRLTRFDGALVAAVTLAVGIFAYQQIALSSDTTRQAGVDAAKQAALSPGAAISLAVLPFDNLSGDASQEFFSDGVTEEITSALARIPDLRVVARTSAYQFRSQNRDIQTIGQQLNATHFIEGSVRKDGERVRITAQLIKADDGTHVWTETYDRQLTDIFAVQEEIGRSISSALRMPLGLKPGQNLISSRDIDPETYQEFLRILANRRAGQVNALETVEALEKLLDRAPHFAKAWAQLSIAYFRANTNGLYEAAVEPAKDVRQQLPPILDKAEKAARESIRLDETEVLAYGTLVEIEFYRNNWVAAEDLLLKGLELDPYGSDLLAARALFLSKTGRLKQVLPVVQEMVALEPLESAVNYGLGWSYLANNRPDAALALLAGTFTNPGTLSVLASAYATTGQYDKAADAILQMGQGRLGRNWGQATFEEAARLIRDAPRKVADSKALLPLHEQLNFVYAYVGAEDRLLDFAERSYEAGLFGEVRYLFNPVYSPARKTERFKTLVRNVGLVDYWKARGWPEMCRPVGADDFECE